MPMVGIPYLCLDTPYSIPKESVKSVGLVSRRHSICRTFLKPLLEVAKISLS